MWVALCSLRVKSSLPVLALAHPDRLVNLFAFAAKVIANLSAIRQRFEHSEDFELLCVPGLKIECLWIFEIREVRQRIELDNKSKCERT